MMEHIPPAGEEEEDIYGGFNEYSAALDTDDLAHDEIFQKAVLRTSHGRRPPPTAARGGMAMGGGIGGMAPGGRLGTAARMGTAARGRMGLPSSLGRPITGNIDGEGAPRPMTAVRAAGFTTAGGRGTLSF
ncbi:hypothetical protein C0Q70_10826 [Pomacea canaliculata]|uniref:Uncharacterized protein n=1 Tax=Pomacea canaliculata TaxID=400727 RepID=A0A2T7P494_POMCA|nr:hypothetical protein C0Q70_10826 [Pomacea canaliculata]